MIPAIFEILVITVSCYLLYRACKEDFDNIKRTKTLN